MSNSIYGNPIVLDTFTSAIDLGNTIYGNSNATFYIEYIEWEEPTTIGHTATITNAKGDAIFNETATVSNQSIIKYFHGVPIYGIKIGVSGVQSGKISILLR